MMRFGIILFSLLLIVMLAMPLSAAILYVRADGSDMNTGESWELAKQTIQAAINAASPGDEVWIKGYIDETVYNEHIELKEGVSVKGGYTGSMIQAI